MGDLHVSRPSDWPSWSARIFAGLARVAIVVEMVPRLRIVAWLVLGGRHRHDPSHIGEASGGSGTANAFSRNEISV